MFSIALLHSFSTSSLASFSFSLPDQISQNQNQELIKVAQHQNQVLIKVGLDQDQVLTRVGLDQDWVSGRCMQPI